MRSRRVLPAAALVLGVTALLVPAQAAPAATVAAPRPAAAVATTHVPSTAAASSSKLLTGVDISWPQCPKGMGIPSRPTEGKPMPKASTKFVVVGVTNGPGFYPNPCLAQQVAWIKAHHVHAAPYAFTTYPTAAQQRKHGSKGPYKGTSKISRLKNAGYAEAQFNVATMKRVGLTAPFIWVDVEESRAPAKWSSNRAYNRAALAGVLAGYRAAGLKVGIYTAEWPWRSIVGSVRYGVPEWRSVGPASKAAALRKCKVRSVQGGPIVMAQWWIDDSPTSNSTDYNVLCPGYSDKADLKRYFHQY